MRKTSLLLVITLLLSSFFCQASFAENEFNIMLDGEKLELAVPHTFINWRTMITIDSGLFEKLGAKAGYDENEEKISIDSDYSTIEMTVNEPAAYIYRKFDFTGIPETIEMDVAPFIENGNVYIPLRFAVEGLGAQVDWDGLSKSVLITTNADYDIIPVERPVEYEEVNIQDIPDDLADWVEANRMTGGIWFKTLDNKTYILICAGEKPTGGYSMQLESITMVAPGSIYVTAQVISPAPDMMVTQVLTYPYILIVIEDEEILNVDGIISDGTIPGEETVSTIGAAISTEDITDMTLYNLMGEKVKTYAPEEYPAIVEAFNNAVIDDSFYIMMLAGNRLVISLTDGTVIEMTSYGSETNIVAAINSQEADGEFKSLHLICPEIAKILLENISE